MIFNHDPIKAIAHLFTGNSVFMFNIVTTTFNFVFVSIIAILTIKLMELNSKEHNS
ncbi:hypothetical protein PRVXT_000987 [Proteinivorax tanatarense]|uniref:Uncharacterized protein n=1 Tax=Proteinivorax tanatarense TaxID=1260629 RepID=A0AAU7VP26_9FIRM